MRDLGLPVIVGLVLGVVAFIVLLGSLSWYLRRRSARLNSIIRDRKGREESQPTEHVLPGYHRYHSHNMSSPAVTKSSFSSLKDGIMSGMTRSRSYSYSTQSMDRTAGMSTATDGALRRNISARSQDTASVYSTPEVEPSRMFHEGRYATQSQEQFPSNQNSATFQSPTTSEHPPTHPQSITNNQSTMTMGQDGSSFRRDPVVRTSYISPKHRETQSLRQNMQETQQIRCIKEELAPETYAKHAWRKVVSSSSSKNTSTTTSMVRYSTTAVNTGIGISQVLGGVNPPGSIEIAGSAILKINETTYQSPLPNYPILVTNYRQKSTSMLSLIPRGPLSYNNIKSFLATPQNTSISTKKSAFPFGVAGDNQNRSDQPYLHTLTPASEVTPITTRTPAPFSPLFVNEPAQFSPATILTSRPMPSRNLKRVD